MIQNSNLGKLYLIPTTLGDNPPLEVLPLTVKKIVEELDFFIVEKEKSARRFIKTIAQSKSQSNLTLFALNKFTDPSEHLTFIQPCLDGIDVGILSEAGCPAIADPGAAIVALAHNNNIKVVPLVGPSSIILALMSSGLNGQNFAFNGYLPIEKTERRKEIKKLERLSSEIQQSQLFIETPYRNNNMLDDLCATLLPQTKLCVACDITLSSELIVTKTAEEWKKNKVDLHKRPTLFIIQK